MNSTVKNIIMVLVFLVCLFLIITGQKEIGLVGLSKELVGLAGLLGLLYVYNRRYK